MFWQPLGTYCLYMATFEKKNPQNMATWAYFLKRILCILCIGFFCQNKDLQIFQPKKIYYSVIVGKYILGQIFNTTNLIL
jgi:hypothetical protein